MPATRRSRARAARRRSGPSWSRTSRTPGPSSSLQAPRLPHPDHPVGRRDRRDRPRPPGAIPPPRRAPAGRHLLRTQNRQDAVKELSRASTPARIGSKNSSNSNRLADGARARQARLPRRRRDRGRPVVRGASVVGLTSGASAPEHLVARMLEWLAARLRRRRACVGRRGGRAPASRPVSACRRRADPAQSRGASGCSPQSSINSSSPSSGPIEIRRSPASSVNRPRGR